MNAPLALAMLLAVQAPAPAADPTTPAPEPAPADASQPATLMEAPATPTDASPTATTLLANPAHWRVEQVPVQGGGKELRVLRGDDTAVSVGEGLADIKQSDRLSARARKLDDVHTSLETILGRVGVLCAGGALTVVGLLAAAGGGVLALASNLGGLSSDDVRLNAIILQGPSIMLTGLIMGVIGVFVVAATAALWGWFILRGPPPPDPAVVQALGAALAWDAKEAAEVVETHNRAVDMAENPPATPASPTDAPPPATDSAPPTTPAPVDPAPAPAPADPAPAALQP